MANALPLLPVDRSRPIHLIGIGGDGMSSLAGLLLEAGFNVIGTQEQGSNLKQPAGIEDLERLGARVIMGHSKAHLNAATAIVVRSSAVAEEHEEIVAARAAGIPVVKRAAVLGELMQSSNVCVAVAGTAGKTTTSAMLSHILMKQKIEVGFSIGSPLRAIYPRNYKIGDGSVFVAEADEYDSSFLALPYNVAIITELFFGDHPDYYRDHEHLMAGFAAFVGRIPETGRLVGYGDNDQILALGKSLPSRFADYGFLEHNSYRITDCTFERAGTRFVVSDRQANQRVVVHLEMVGRQNVANATAAIVTAGVLGIPLEQAASAVRDFPGTARRMEHIGTSQSGLTIYDDYAHNPIQIAATIGALRQKYPAHRITCLFEPRQYLRTKMMLDQFAGAFSVVDQVLVLDISEGLGDRPEQREIVHSSDLVRSLLKQGVQSVYVGSRIDAFGSIGSYLKPGDLLVTMGTGRLAEFARSILTL